MEAQTDRRKDEGTDGQRYGQTEVRKMGCPTNLSPSDGIFDFELEPSSSFFIEDIILVNLVLVKGRIVRTSFHRQEIRQFYEMQFSTQIASGNGKEES